ncbi:matrix protein [Charleville virus]|uniref:Matrix protein n=1 Tax=Charleville virus TaxID=318842 RepID=A0A3S8TMQ0_9RHAB|nr:matrix protein [Charleville virus]AZL49335.1 matrix protein [Charleville virus]
MLIESGLKVTYQVGVQEESVEKLLSEEVTGTRGRTLSKSYKRQGTLLSQFPNC